MTNRRSCTHHCGGCDQHFTSLAAFDAHRAGAYDGHRFCRPASYVSKLRAVKGRCALTVLEGVPTVLEGVSLWEDAANVDKARRAFPRAC